jgi:hypothetical protein
MREGQFILVEHRHGPSVSLTMYAGWFKSFCNGVLTMYMSHYIDGAGDSRYGHEQELKEDVGQLAIYKISERGTLCTLTSRPTHTVT